MADKSIMDSLSEFGRNNPITDAGKYWENDNAQFDASNPSLGARVWRGINPMTGLGSAMGSVHTAAGKGDLLMAALASFGALPVFGATKAVKAVIPSVLPSLGKTVARQSKNEASQLIVDALAAQRARD